MEPTRRIVASARIFAPSAALLEALRAVRAQRGADDMTQAHDAFLLDPGLGPATYLTSDGRILWDDDLWDVEGTRRDAFAAIVVGAKKTAVVALLDLLPSRDASARDCAECAGTGWFDGNGQLKDAHGKSFSFVCPTCAGLGWTSPSIVLIDSVLESTEP